MDKLLTKKDLAERWQVTTKTIDNYIADKVVTPVKNIPAIRFNPQHIAELEETKLDKFSPLERRRMEREIEELRARLEKAESALSKVNRIIVEAIYEKIKEA